MSQVAHTGFTIWFTGLSGAGKTTVAHRVAELLQQRLSREVEILDGDVVRTHLSKGLGFSREDRDINIRRIGWVCHVLTKHGVPNIAAAISPYRGVRDEVRKMVGRFVEVYAECLLDVCEQRDVKGSCRRAPPAAEPPADAVASLGGSSLEAAALSDDEGQTLTGHFYLGEKRTFLFGVDKTACCP